MSETPEPPTYRHFHYAVQQTCAAAEVVNLILQVHESYPSIPVGVIGRFLVDLDKNYQPTLVTLKKFDLEATIAELKKGMSL